MQPWLTVAPIEPGSLVPWMAIGPSCGQFLSVGENAETPVDDVEPREHRAARKFTGRERLTRDGDDGPPLAAHALDGAGPAGAGGGAPSASCGRGRDREPGQR